MEVKAEELLKIYDKEVLNIKELVFKSGLITAIVGPNGSGKSTLLNIIAATLKKDGGRVYYDGSLTVPLQKMTIVFQKPFLIDASVYMNIAYPLKIRKISKEEIKSKVKKIARDLNIEDLLNKNAHHLSGGEKAKVSLARALIFQPELLLLDEPCASLDPYIITEIEKILFKINKEEKTTIILITHDLGEAKRIADEILLLNKGKVVALKKRDDFFNSDDETVRRFINGELLI